MKKYEKPFLSDCLLSLFLISYFSFLILPLIVTVFLCDFWYMVHLHPTHTIPLQELQALANNNAIARNLKDVFPYPYTLRDATEFLALSGEGKLGHTFGIFDENRFVGVGSITPKEDIYRNNGEIGYWIGEPFWGRGYGSAAVELLTAYAFRELRLIRVYAGVFSTNPASMRVLEKAGYTLEAVLRSAVTKHDQVLDEYIYSILTDKYKDATHG